MGRYCEEKGPCVVEPNSEILYCGLKPTSRPPSSWFAIMLAAPSPSAFILSGSIEKEVFVLQMGAL